jgi:hypothetical protein
MANAVQTKLQKISAQYSAKVDEIRKLKADKRKPFVTDAQIKTINQKIDKLDRERLQINTQLTKLTKLAKTAEEYIKLNDKLKELEASIARAESRGESTVSFKQQRTGATSRLKAIASDVERNFPEIKVTTPKPVVTTKKPVVTTKKPILTTPKPGVVTTLKPGVVTTKKPVVTTKKPIVTTPKTGVVTTQNPSSLETLLKRTEFWYDLPDYIFKLEPKLGELLVRAVDEGWDPNTEVGRAKFLAGAEATPWWRKNAPALRTRIIEREKYNDLIAAGENADKTEYGLYLSKKKNDIKNQALNLAGVTLT